MTTDWNAGYGGQAERVKEKLSSKIPMLSKKEFLERGHFDFAVAFEEALQRKTDATGLVLFENLQMDSSSYGRMTAMLIGPTNTYKSVEDCEGKFLGELPSHRQYPVAWVPRKEFLP